MILSGKSAVVMGDPYVMTLHLPNGFRIETADVKGEQVEIAHQKETGTVRIVPSATGVVEWEVTCSKSMSRVTVNQTEAIKADMAFFTDSSCSQLNRGVQTRMKAPCFQGAQAR